MNQAGVASGDERCGWFEDAAAAGGVRGGLRREREGLRCRVEIYEDARCRQERCGGGPWVRGEAGGGRVVAESGCWSGSGRAVASGVVGVICWRTASRRGSAVEREGAAAGGVAHQRRGIEGMLTDSVADGERSGRPARRHGGCCGTRRHPLIYSFRRRRLDLQLPKEASLIYSRRRRRPCSA